MNVVCLGWGSLIWDKRCLPVSGRWNCDGPSLPIEFARESGDGRITLVVAKGTACVPVLWCNLCPDHINDIDQAKSVLAVREGVAKKNIKCFIGFWTPDDCSGHIGADIIGEWAQSCNIDAVVWTALESGLKPNSEFKLEPDIKRKRDCVPDIEDIIKHLKNLPEKNRQKAEEYVRKAPRQIETNYRTAIETKLGWTPNPPDKSALP